MSEDEPKVNDEDEDADDEEDDGIEDVPTSNGERPRRGDKAKAQAEEEAKASVEADLAEQEAAATELVGKMFAARRQTLDAERASELIAEAQSLLGRVDDATFRQMTGNEEFQDLFLRASTQSGKNPGDPIYDDKGRMIDRVPWTAEFVWETYPTVEYIPPETEQVSVNGVSFQVFEGIPNKVPSIIRDIHMESYTARRNAVRGQLAALENSQYRASDGVNLTVGWAPKAKTAEDILKQPGWAEV